MLIRHWFPNAILVMGIFHLQACQQSRTGYVDTFKLVSEFELQKEYSAQTRKSVEEARTSIDSLLAVEKIKDSARLDLMKKDLYGALSQKAEERSREIEKMIWNRLNPYLKEYGKEYDYQYIYGANGTGNILYASDQEDITEDLIKYVNKKYHDK